jgi:cell division protein FtsW (lipid II flippase)
LNNIISEFLQQVCSQTKYKKIYSDISKELQGHIQDIMDGYIENGMSEEEAVQRAVQQMGSPIEIGKGLHKIHRPKTEWSIIALIGAMVLIGCIVLISIAGDNASRMTLGQFFRSYIPYTIVGLGIGALFYFLDYTRLEKYSLHIFAAASLLLLLRKLLPDMYVSFYGIPFIVIGPLAFNLYSVLLPLFLISFAGIVKKWADGSAKNMVKILALAAASGYLHLSEPALAYILIIACGYLVMITYAILDKNFRGNRVSFLLHIYGWGMAGAFLVYKILPHYQLARLRVFINPKADPLGDGYMYLVMEKLFSGAKLFGKSDYLYFDHQGTQMFLLPEPSTDFVYAYIISAFGWIAAIMVAIISITAVARMYLSTRSVTDGYGKYLSIAILTVFSLQVLSSILMNLGFFPVMGMSLPFVSFGGSNFLANMVLIGLLLGVYRRKDIIPARVSS